MAFLESRLPVGVTYGSQGGPGYNTRIVTSASGHEDRNANWSFARHTFEWQTSAVTEPDMEQLRIFFHALKGSWAGFRVRDERDYKSCLKADDPAYDDQILGVGDGVEDTFQLKKTYTYGALSAERTIQKPDANFTPLVGVLGSARLEADATYPWSWDSTTGEITFTSTVPPSGNVTAGFLFDVPVRWSTDNLIDVFLAYEMGQSQIPIIEIRP